MFGLDGDELYYADFVNKKAVYPQPPFADPMNFGEDAYQTSEAELQICKTNLENVRRGYKNPKAKLGKYMKSELCHFVFTSLHVNIR